MGQFPRAYKHAAAVYRLRRQAATFVLLVMLGAMFAAIWHFTGEYLRDNPFNDYEIGEHVTFIATGETVRVVGGAGRRVKVRFPDGETLNVMETKLRRPDRE